jgi:hypothetical protein
MEHIKSKLEVDLEAQGWEFLVNVHPMDGRWFIPKKDEKIRTEYLKKGFKDVKVERAYDIKGKPLVDLRAIYVKDPDNIKTRVY